MWDVLYEGGPGPAVFDFPINNADARLEGFTCVEQTFSKLRLEPCWKHTYVGSMLFTKVDAWIGRTLFIPPIIKLCQLTRQTQFAVSRLFWFIAALDGLYRAETLFSSVLWGGMSVLMMVTAARRADSPTASFMFFRMLGLLLLAIDLVRATTAGEWAGVEFWVFVLIAEYAATIRAVPPRDAVRKMGVETSTGA